MHIIKDVLMSNDFGYCEFNISHDAQLLGVEVRSGGFYLSYLIDTDKPDGVDYYQALITRDKDEVIDLDGMKFLSMVSVPTLLGTIPYYVFYKVASSK
jgi:hypothetical protein